MNLLQNVSLFLQTKFFLGSIDNTRGSTGNTACTPSHPLLTETRRDQLPGISPEKALLLRAAQRSLGIGETSLLRKMTATELNWEILPRLAQRHRLTALVHKFLGAQDADVVPPAVQNDLQQNFLAITRQTLYLARELLDLLELFQSAGLVVIPYKGPALGAAVYGNISLREFSDLDILIAPEDAPDAAQLLIQQGFQPCRGAGKTVTAVQSDPNEKDLPFFHAERNVYLELHYKLARHYQGFPMDTRILFRRQQEAQLLHTPIPVLSPEDNLLVLCFNGAKDRWNRFSLICDVAAQLKAAPGLDWQYIWQQAVASRMTRRLLLGLSLAQTFLEAPLPPEISGKIHPNRRIHQLQQQVCEWLFAEGPVLRWGWQKNWFTIRSFDKKNHQLISARRFAREILQVTENDRQTGWKANFPVAGRLFRLTRKYIKSFF